jgi:hypothetical protein
MRYYMATIGKEGAILTKRKYLIIISLVIAIVLIGSLLYGVYLKMQEDGREDKVKIINVSHEPENPLPGQKITITAIAENSSECNIQWRSYFTEGRNGGWSMGSIGDGKYVYETSSGFENGTEVSYRVCAIGSDSTFAVSNEYTIQIGEVERSDITTLSISDVQHSPQNPTKDDMYLTFCADVTSNVTISNVELVSSYFTSTSGGSFGDKMMKKNGNTYEYLFLNNMPGIYPIPKGAMVFYKVVAQDESGNTAVSPSFSFTIS